MKLVRLPEALLAAGVPVETGPPEVAAADGMAVATAVEAEVAAAVDAEVAAAVETEVAILVGMDVDSAVGAGTTGVAVPDMLVPLEFTEMIRSSTVPNTRPVIPGFPPETLVADWVELPPADVVADTVGDPLVAAMVAAGVSIAPPEMLVWTVKPIS